VAVRGHDGKLADVLIMGKNHGQINDLLIFADHRFTLSNMDMLIGAHSIAIDATLVTNDKAFTHLSNWVDLENWIHD